MFLKALGVKYASRYQSYGSAWKVELIADKGWTRSFMINEMVVDDDLYISGSGKDDNGEFKISGSVNKFGFAEFAQEYPSNHNVPITNFHGNFTNAYNSGTWVTKGHGTGKFEMKMINAKPFAFMVAEASEVIYVDF